MSSTDPASLQNLNDIVLPDAVGWWPLAPGWYVLAGLTAIAMLLFFLRSVRNWRNNRYRRSAIKELQSLFDTTRNPGERTLNLQHLPGLIKRVALCAYPRTDVAMLSGDSWCDFLDSTAGKTIFTTDVREAFSLAAYQPGRLQAMDDRTAHTLIRACEYWLRHHRPSGSRKYQERT